MQVWQESGPSWALGVIALGLLVVAAAAWRRRSMPTAMSLALLCLTLAIWALADGLGAAATVLSLKVVLTRIEWLCVLCAGPLWLQFANSFARRPPLGWRRLLPLWALAGVLAPLVASNAYGLTFAHVSVKVTGVGAVGVYHYGPLAWAAGICVIVTVVLGVGHVLRAALSSSASYRRQALILACVGTLPVIIDIIDVAGLSPLPQDADLAPFTFVFAVAFFGWVLSQGVLPGIAPLARDTLLRTLPDGVLVLDLHMHLTEANAAVCRMLGLDRRRLNRPASTALDEWPLLVDALDRPAPWMGDIVIAGDDGRELWMEIRTSPLEDDAGRPQGKLATLHDVTTARRSQRLASVQRDLALAIGACNDEVQAMVQLLEVLTSIDSVDAGGAYLRSPATGAFDMVADLGLSEHFARSVMHYDADSSRVRLAAQGTPTYITYREFIDAVGDLTDGTPPELRELRGTAVIPVMHGGAPVAIISLFSRTRDEFADETRRLLELAAAEVGSLLARIRAEHEARRNSARTRALVEALPDTMLVMDSAGRIVDSHAAYEAALDLTEETIGKSLEEILPAALARRFRSGLARLDATAEVQILDYELGSNGEHRSYEARLASAGMGQSLAVVRDVTDHSRAMADLRQQTDRLTALLNASLATTSTLDYKKVLEAIARAAGEALGSPQCVIWEYLAESDEELCRCLYELTPGPGLQEEFVGSCYSLQEFPEDRALILGGEIVQESIGDPGMDPEVREAMIKWGEKTSLSVPLQRDGEVFGMMVLIETERARTFGDDERRLARALGEQAATAMRNARLYSRVREHSQRLASLLEATRAVTSTVVLDEILSHVAHYAAAAVDSPIACIYEYDAASDSLITRARYGPEGLGRQEPLGLVDPLGNWPLDRLAIEHGEIVEQRIGDPDLPDVVRQRFLEWGEKSSLVVPIRFRGQTLGEFELIETDRERHFTQEDRELMSAFSEQVAIAIATARAHDAQVEQNRRLSALLSAARAIAGSLDYDQVLEQVVRQGRLGMGVDKCVLYEYDADEEMLTVRARDDDVGTPAVYQIGHRRGLSEISGEREALLSGSCAVWDADDESIPTESRAAMLPGGDQACLLVPLVHHGEPIGELLFIEHGKGHLFTQEEKELAVGLGEQAVLAIVNARLHSRAESQLALRHDLLTLSESLLSTLDDASVFDHVASTLKSLVAYDSVSVGVVSESADELHMMFAYGRDAEVVRDRRLPLDTGVTGDVLRSGAAELINDMLRDPRRAFQLPGTLEDEQASLIVPIRLGTRSAVLSVDRFGGELFQPDDLETVRLFASIAAVALENARLYKVAEEQAITDGLTGLYNHRHFYERLGLELARARRSGTSLAMLMIDLDDFKRLNDDYGHVAGDHVLRAIGRALDDCTRRGVDLAARYGGEEFAVFLPDTSMVEPDDGDRADGALAVAERIRATVAAASVACEVNGELKEVGVTVSIGVAVFPTTAATMGELVAQADAALYLAKRRGKDRVEVYGVR
jgi:diguanylate cyclase (GGDEF)-like protein/PAS domain S-box-containing protein